MKVLLIDDNKDITTMFSKYLTMKGFDCTVSNNGNNGLNLIKRNQYDYVILDLAMPEFGGADVIESLEMDNSLAKNKIVILTASSVSNEQISEFENKNGIVTVLRKPIQLSELLQVLI